MSRSLGLHVAVLAAVYVFVAKLGLDLGAVSGFATLVWAPTGLSLAALLLFGTRIFPGVFLGALIVNVWTGASLPVAIGIAVGNTAEAILGAFALLWLAGYQGTFDRLRHVMALLVPAAILSTLVSASVGVTSLLLGGFVPPEKAIETWQAWWVGDVLGDLVVAPLLLTWATAREVPHSLRRTSEIVALGAGVMLASWAVFSRPLVMTQNPSESPYILFPLFVWAAVRFELRGAATATATASVIAIWGTARGYGPFARESLAGSLLALQTFMGSAAFTPLVVAGAVSDRARAMRSRENFVAIVSHELRSPLGVIQMSSEALARALPDDSRIQRNDELVRRSVSRMTRLLGDLLDAAAIDAGRLALDPREESVRSLITEAVELHRPFSAARQQELTLALDDDLGVKCDRERILQVLSNLIGNAIKFSPEGSAVVVRAERNGKMACVMVEDRGRGIEAAKLRLIFERFWRATSVEGGGAGLGLFIAKGIVQAHGGRLWAESKPGFGSTFSFTLPLGDADVARAKSSIAPPR